MRAGGTAIHSSVFVMSCTSRLDVISCPVLVTAPNDNINAPNLEPSLQNVFSFPMNLLRQ